MSQNELPNTKIDTRGLAPGVYGKLRLWKKLYDRILTPFPKINCRALEFMQLNSSALRIVGIVF